MQKWKSTGVFSSKAAAENSRRWWQRQGYATRIGKVVGGYKVYYRR